MLSVPINQYRWRPGSLPRMFYCVFCSKNAVGEVLCNALSRQTLAAPIRTFFKFGCSFHAFSREQQRLIQQ